MADEGAFDPRTRVANRSNFAPEAFEWPAESGETTHISVVDEERNAVALTYTLEDNYGSKIVGGLPASSAVVKRGMTAAYWESGSWPGPKTLKKRSAAVWRPKTSWKARQ